MYRFIYCTKRLYFTITYSTILAALSHFLSSDISLEWAVWKCFMWKILQYFTWKIWHCFRWTIWQCFRWTIWQHFQKGVLFTIILQSSKYKPWFRSIGFINGRASLSIAKKILLNCYSSVRLAINGIPTSKVEQLRCIIIINSYLTCNMFFIKRRKAKPN